MTEECPGKGNVACNIKQDTLNLFTKSSEQLDSPLNVGILPTPSRHPASLLPFVTKDMLS